jgi:hypothetical protein
MSADPDKLAVEAEADRLSGVYVRIRLLAQAQGVDVIEAGRGAAAVLAQVVGLVCRRHRLYEKDTRFVCLACRR